MSHSGRPRLAVSTGRRTSPTYETVKRLLCDEEKRWALKQYGIKHLSPEDSRVNVWESICDDEFAFNVNVVRQIMLERGDVLEPWALAFDDEMHDDEADEGEAMSVWYEEYQEMLVDLIDEASTASLFRLEGPVVVVCAAGRAGVRLVAIEPTCPFNAALNAWPTPP